MSRAEHIDESLGLWQYVRVLRRQRLCVLIGTAAGFLVAAAILLIGPHSYTATTTVSLNVISTEPFSQQRNAASLIDPQTEADIARSHVVAESASKALGGDPTPWELRRDSTVQAPGDATVVRVSYTGPSEALATKGADAVATAYLEYRSAQAEARLQKMQTHVNEQIERLNEELVEANAAAAASDADEAERGRAAALQQQVQVELDSLLTHRIALANVDTTGGAIITPAEDSPRELSPGIWLTLGTGTGAGVVLGIVLAFVRDPFDHRLRTEADIAEALGAPLLAKLTGELGQPLSEQAAGEEMRVVREQLLQVGAGHGPVLVFDARRSESQSTAAAALEWAASRYFTVGTLRATESRADCLAALRTSTATLVVCWPRTALTDDLSWFAREAQRAGTPVTGFVIEP